MTAALPSEACDIAIIGGGAAGAILAARLSERPDRRVVLIEAGRDTPPGAVPSDIADVFPRAYSNPRYFWPDLTAIATQGAPARPFLQARIMGGGSSVMGMWALRGQPRDYDLWRNAGALGWGWDDVLPAFKRLERDLDHDGELHGDEGPIPIRRHPAAGWPAFIQDLARAAARHSLPLHSDINADFDDGVFPVPVSTDGAQRATSAGAYLTASARARPNLEILTDTLVTRLVFEARRVSGVEILRSGTVATLGARMVVLTAGAIGTPAILLRSGIGPADELHQLGITPVIDLRGVGKSLQNHCIVNLAARIAPEARQAHGLRSYALACARLSSHHPEGRPGDLHLQFITRTSLNPHGDRIGLVGAALYAPLSRGTVSLSCADPHVPPLIDFRLLDHPADRARLAQAVRVAMRLLSDGDVRRHRDEVLAIQPSSMIRRLNRPGLGNLAMSAMLAAALDLPKAIRRTVLRSAGKRVPEDDLATGTGEQLLDHCTPIFHPSGSCAIGRPEDPLAVLDPLCRVRGVDGLHVGDAAIMPVIPTGNTCLPAMMIAEHLAHRLIAAKLC